jgi:hypothetical protein
MVKNIPPSQPFWTGFTRIEHAKGETQEQFEATKGDATYPVGSDSHVLVLDGKLDEAVASGVHAWSEGERLITDIRELAPKVAAIRDACKKSDDELVTSEVDLGTGYDWVAFPNKDPKTHAFASYDLISGPGPQQISVRFEGEETRLWVSTKDKQRDLGHSMSAQIKADGTCEPIGEGVSWQLAR